MVSNDKYSQVTIVIPCYNEETTIGTVIARMLSLDVGNIIIVDDGSTDDSARIIKVLAKYGPITYLRNPQNMGQGASTNKGIHYSTNYKKSKYVVTVDADDQHLPEDVTKVMDRLLESNNLIVHGTRDFSNGIPYSKKITNLISRMMFLILYQINIPDPTSGLRGYNKSLISEIKFESGHEYIVGANRLIKKYKKFCGFASITARYTDYSLKKGLNFQKGIGLLAKMILGRIKEIFILENSGQAELGSKRYKTEIGAQ